MVNRAPKTHYCFYQRRAGDVISVPDAKARMMYLSAFAKWIKGRAGSLRATSRAVGGVYQITFTGISPTEANEARLRGSPPPPPSQPPGDDI
jgi:hypothetical protein